MKLKEESEQVGLNLNIQKTMIMVSGPITSWQIDGETVKTVADFIWGAPKSLQMVIAAYWTDVEAETPILWPLDVKSWLIGKDPDAGKDWGQEEKGITEDEMVGWHHRLNGHGFGWTPEVGDGQEGLASYGSWGHKEPDTAEWLNWAELNWTPLKELSPLEGKLWPT